MASSARIDELEKKFNENERRYFAPLANEYRKMGDLERAIYICEQFLPQQPGHMSGHIVYGQALFESGRIDDARGVFETALSLDPENLIALRHLGDISARQEDPGAARRWYERVLEADPRNEEIHGLLSGLSDTASGARHETARDLEPAAVDDWQESIAEASPTIERSSASVEPAVPELLDLEVTLPSTPTPLQADSSPRAEQLPDLPAPSIGDIETLSDTADLMPDSGARADGFESTEFAAPPAPVEQALGLQSAYEDEVEGSAARVAPIAPLAGLEAHPGILDEAQAHATSSGLPELDESLPEDEGLVLPPHGDPIAATGSEHDEATGESAGKEPAPSPTVPDAELLDFEMPSEPGEDVGTAETVPIAPPADIPRELPPEVIAAEAELLDADASAATVFEPESSASAAAEPRDTESIGSELSFIDVGAQPEAEPEDERAPESEAVTSNEEALEPEPSTHRDGEGEAVPATQRPFVTETMAELYLKQGLRTEALSVYEQLSAANPGDARLIARVTSLRIETAVPAVSSGPPVREFFARLAARRPGERAAAAAPPAEDDFASAEFSDWDGAPEDDAPQASAGYAETRVADEVTTVEESAGDAVAAEEDVATEERPRAGGSIDALFGHQPATPTEDSAASALAQAFGGEPESPTIAGNPTRQATGELSLDSVFRDGTSRGQRSSQGFSFDQFFTQHPEGERTTGGGRGAQDAPPEGEPAERNADDIEQFNAWLQGLKQR
ncbi:MAG TPA: tetratricopeptide repeat protein [Gemmatimonadaceae bacterium]|nr:tetratricopeptide repeat protein [Gemmatimonadaceae bacterium]